ncbi:hypothetical protein [Aquiflexum gelatinilyticum]|uniref:hypothetical protein n=1 Tax=Aquiflexum gelatinilyticum TaxID=2961943 RepID=UPI002168F508|nr:hypothetical protein [Aquiflexum gelatinilyticum]MCS4435966.1 hypothetical protein [Aquiflexum gelatinilyticum]
MEERIINLKMRFQTASKEEQAEIDREMQNLALENPEAFSKAMLEDLGKTLHEIAQINESKSRID